MNNLIVNFFQYQFPMSSNYTWTPNYFIMRFSHDNIKFKKNWFGVFEQTFDECIW